MPIVDVEIVAEDPGVPHGLASRLAESLAGVFSSPPGRVWVRLSVLPSAHYAENGAQGPLALPVFVRVLHADLPSDAVRSMQAQAISNAVAACVARPSLSVHVEYAPAGRGRMAFGGQLLR
jgi:phenylpyruvate tautomerase PptA (4-oxalocrotonate tautomerase family)